MKVELVTHKTPRQAAGIGRYAYQLYKNLSGRIPISLVQSSYLPFSDRLSVLNNFPIGIPDHEYGSVVHFTQIKGCAQMLWHPLHPAIATVHDLGFLQWPEEGKMLGVVGRQLMRLQLAGLAKTDHLIAVSEFTRQGLIKHLGIPPNKITTIYQGIDLSRFRHINGARELLVKKYPVLTGRDSPWLLYVGSELPRKNLGVLLKAVQILCTEYPHLTMIKVGAAGGEKFRSLTMHHIKQTGVQDRVVFLGIVPEEDLPLVYSAADVYVHPSFLEGFGFPVLEAFACGTPVVATSSGALPEIMQGIGPCIPAENAEQLALAVSAVLIDSKAARALSGRGIEVANLFSITKTIERTLGLYRNFVDGASNENEPNQKNEKVLGLKS